MKRLFRNILWSIHQPSLESLCQRINNCIDNLEVLQLIDKASERLSYQAKIILQNATQAQRSEFERSFNLRVQEMSIIKAQEKLLAAINIADKGAAIRDMLYALAQVEKNVVGTQWTASKKEKVILERRSRVLGNKPAYTRTQRFLRALTTAGLLSVAALGGGYGVKQGVDHAIAPSQAQHFLMGTPTLSEPSRAQDTMGLPGAWCSAWVQKQMMLQFALNAKALKHLGIYGDAWTIYLNMRSTQSSYKMPYNAYEHIVHNAEYQQLLAKSQSFYETWGVGKQTQQNTEEYEALAQDIRQFLTRHTTPSLEDIRNVTPQVRMGAIVGMYYAQSAYQIGALVESRGATPNTHVGIVLKMAPDGMPIISHLYHDGSVHENRLDTLRTTQDNPEHLRLAWIIEPSEQ